jgi:hypothetical protein
MKATRTNLNIQVPFLSEHDGVLKVEVEQDYHLAVTRLVECVLDVVVKNVNLEKNSPLLIPHH